MTTKIKDTVLGESIDERIARLEYLVSLGLKADNFTTVESRYITYVGDVLAKLKLENLATINNVDMASLNASINYLSETNIEKKAIPFEVIVISDPDGNSDHREVHENKIDIPLGWDGRNSFVFYKLMGTTYDTPVDYITIDKEKLIKFSKDQWIDMSKNRTSLKFNSLAGTR